MVCCYNTTSGSTCNRANNQENLNIQQLPSGNIYEVIGHDVSESSDILNAWNSVIPEKNRLAERSSKTLDHNSQP